MPKQEIHWPRVSLIALTIGILTLTSYLMEWTVPLVVLLIISAAFLCFTIFLLFMDTKVSKKVITIRCKIQPHYKVYDNARMELLSFAYEGKDSNGSVSDWCRENLGYLPAVYPKRRHFRTARLPFFLFFRRASDAFAFKMRWG